MFRKTKSNNFFSVEESPDQIQPFDEEENSRPKSPAKTEIESKQG